MEQELEVSSPSSSRAKTIAIAAVIALLVLLLVGGIGELSGTGWFGYRAILYGSGDLYLLNLGDKPVEVLVEGNAPVSVPPEDARIVQIIGGQQEITATTKGQKPETFSFMVEDSDALLRLDAADRCLVAVNLDPFYGGAGSKSQVEILKKIKAEAGPYVPGSHNVIWPRKPFPPRLDAEGGEGVWIETVGCPLLKDEPFLDAYMTRRLTERMQKAKGGPAVPPRRRGP